MTPPTAKDQTKVLSGENFSSREPLSVLTICVDEDTAQSVRFFAESPLTRVNLDLSRDADLGREIKL